MSDPFDPAEPLDPEDPSEDGPFPWDAEPAPEDPDAPRQRHDAFTEARKSEFLKVLVKTGCIQDACRKTGISPRTVYRHQESSAQFFDNCVLALRMSGTPIELTAWARAVDGVEQEYVVAGEVRVRRRYDAGLLRLLLQGSNPKKYGPRPGFKRKRLLRHERKQMEREIRAEIGSTMRATTEETCKALAKRLRAFGIRTEAEEEQAKLADGWTKSPEGHWVPPGYAPIPGWQPPAAVLDAPADAVPGDGTPRDSM